MIYKVDSADSVHALGEECLKFKTVEISFEMSPLN